MKKKKADHRYVECGLNNIILKNIDIFMCECGEEEILIPNMEHLHGLIAKVIAAQRYRLLPEEVRFLRSHLGWSGVDFAKAFAVTPESVSRWEHGKEKMSLTLERFLRMLIICEFGPFHDYKDDLPEYGREEHKKPMRRIFVAKKNELKQAA